MTPQPTFYTLAALLDSPAHSYGIIMRAHALSDGHVRLTAGTLYATLDRLVHARLVEVDREEVVEGRARRYYRLTESGGALLRTEAKRMARAAAVVAAWPGRTTAAGAPA